MIWPCTKLEKGLVRDTGNEGLQATPGFFEFLRPNSGRHTSLRGEAVSERI